MFIASGISGDFWGTKVGVLGVSAGFEQQQDDGSEVTAV
jgi:hypothetical protein